MDNTNNMFLKKLTFFDKRHFLLLHGERNEKIPALLTRRHCNRWFRNLTQLDEKVP